MRDSIMFLSRCTTDVPVRGAFELRSGETAIILDGGRVLVCKTPRLLSDHASAALLTEWDAAHANEACGFAALGNKNGPSSAEILAQRREKTQRDRDRRTIRIDDPSIMEPQFLSEMDDVIGLHRTNVELKARMEEISRDIPDV